MDITTLSPLLTHLFMILEAHRPAFRQERSYRRAMALVLGELFAFGKHTVTQLLMSLGLGEADWSAWYRLFSQERYDEEKLADCLLGEVVGHVPEREPFVIGVDSFQIPRDSRKMPGSCWLRAPRTAVFMRGIHRAQRFVNVAWLLPIVEGYSRALPLRLVAAFTAKARPALEPPRKEWEAALEGVSWVRAGLDRLGRQAQPVLLVGDGGFDNVKLWQGLPAGVVAIVRTAKNRCLYELPAPYEGRGRRRKYGPRLLAPQEWLHVRRGWHDFRAQVRNRQVQLRYRVVGPCVRRLAAERPLFLIVIKGATYKAGKRAPRIKYRKPGFYLVSAVETESGWALPLPDTELLGWVWQRWELEVAHREMKSSWGIGDKQCWNPRSVTTAVQFSAWVYAILLLAGYRAWGLTAGPPVPTRWWRGSRRWSFNTLWRGFRAALWTEPDFKAVWTPTGDDWPKKEAWVAGLANAVASAMKA